MKIMTINLYRYHDWEARKRNISLLVREQAPDFIAMQEVLTNHAFSDFPQSDFIADEGGYGYRSFAPTLLRMNARDTTGVRNQQASEGQACISKYPIVSTETYFLKQHTDYPEAVSVQFCTIDAGGVLVEFCNVHFANNHVAYSHLDELLELIEKRGTRPIILGDFNIYKLVDYKQDQSLLRQYCLSSEDYDYVSYQPGGESLDYIAVPSSIYKFEAVTCPELYVSDHSALVATVRTIK